MRLFLNVAACVLIGAMLAPSLLAAKGLDGFTSSNLAMAALGLAGVMLGRWGSQRPAKVEAPILT
jgi:VIT1/CCC1 family predicted Fe2+/Mn2+ transporter